MTDRIATGQAAARAAYEAAPGRFRILHDSHYADCDGWGEWTERDVPLFGGGRGDVDYVGCRSHSMAVAR
jgi:hypothetical protein